MDSEEFINAIKLAVKNSAATGMLRCAERPPGRSISEEQKKCSAWIKSLKSSDREILLGLLEGAVDSAIFGMLCVIDGVRVVEPGPEQGRFELIYVNREGSVLLNPDNGEMLHDIYNSQ